MKRLIVLICLAVATGTAGAANLIYNQPLLENPTDAARFYIYDPVTHSDRNITWGILRGFFAPIAPPWASIANKPSVFTPAPHTQGIETIDGLRGELDGKANAAGLAAVATSGAYGDLSGRPVLFSGLYSDLMGLPTLFSGDYNDLTNKPATFPPAAHQQAASTITGLATVATTGNYGDLSNRPSIPASTTNLPEGTNLYFTSSRAVSAAQSLICAPDGTGVYDGKDGINGADGAPGPPGPANSLSIGGVTTLPPGSAATATITGTAPAQTLSLGIPQGIQGDPGNLTRDQITNKILVPSDTIIYVQPATNSPTAGGVVINDYEGNAAVIVRNGMIKIQDAAGVAVAEINRAARSLTMYKTTGSPHFTVSPGGGLVLQ